MYWNHCYKIICWWNHTVSSWVWIHDYDFMSDFMLWNKFKNHEIVYMKRIFGRALSRFRCGFGRSRVAFHYDCTMNSNCAQPAGWMLSRSGARLLSRLLSSVRPVHHPAAERWATRLPGESLLLNSVPLTAELALLRWFMLGWCSVQRFSWGCCAGPPLESYEVVDDDVERAILLLSWDGCHCDFAPTAPSLWVTWGRRMHAAAEAAHDGVLDLCPLVSWLSTYCRRLVM